MTTDELLAHLRRLVDEAGTQRDLAQQMGISATYLNDVLLKRNAPGKKLLAAMGFERVVTYRKTNRT